MYAKLTNGEEKISVVGLGYVGLPLAVAFSKKAKVIGFDLNTEKITWFMQGIDPSDEVGSDAIKACQVEFTADPGKLCEAKVHIVTVPTPVNEDHAPDLSAVENASRMIGRNLVKGSLVVYESTVYPGVTEEICVPILEKESGLRCGIDFKVGYSPERINPGDKNHRLDNTVKIVSGIDAETLEEIANIYGLIVLQKQEQKFMNQVVTIQVQVNLYLTVQRLNMIEKQEKKQ